MKILFVLACCLCLAGCGGSTTRHLVDKDGNEVMQIDIAWDKSHGTEVPETITVKTKDGKSQTFRHTCHQGTPNIWREVPTLKVMK